MPRYGQGQGYSVRAGCGDGEKQSEERAACQKPGGGEEETRKRCGKGQGAVRGPEVAEGGAEFTLAVGWRWRNHPGQRSQPTLCPSSFLPSPAPGGLGHLPDLEEHQETVRFPCLQSAREGEEGGAEV